MKTCFTIVGMVFVTIFNLMTLATNYAMNYGPNIKIQSKVVDNVTSLEISNHYCFIGNDKGEIYIIDIKSDMIVEKYFYDGFNCIGISCINDSLVNFSLANFNSGAQIIFKSIVFNTNQFVVTDTTILDNIPFESNNEASILNFINYDGRFIIKPFYQFDDDRYINKTRIEIYDKNTKTTKMFKIDNSYIIIKAFIVKNDKLAFLTKERNLSIYNIKDSTIKEIILPNKNKILDFEILKNGKYLALFYNDSTATENKELYSLYSIQDNTFIYNGNKLIDKHVGSNDIEISDSGKYIFESLSPFINVFDNHKQEYHFIKFPSFGNNPMKFVHNKLYFYSNANHDNKELNSNHFLGIFDFSNNAFKKIDFLSNKILDFTFDIDIGLLILTTDEFNNPIKILNFKETFKLLKLNHDLEVNPKVKIDPKSKMITYLDKNQDTLYLKVINSISNQLDSIYLKTDAETEDAHEYFIDTNEDDKIAYCGLSTEKSFTLYDLSNIHEEKFDFIVYDALFSNNNNHLLLLTLDSMVCFDLNSKKINYTKHIHLDENISMIPKLTQTRDGSFTILNIHNHVLIFNTSNGEDIYDSYDDFLNIHSQYIDDILLQEMNIYMIYNGEPRKFIYRKKIINNQIFAEIILNLNDEFKIFTIPIDIIEYVFENSANEIDKYLTAKIIVLNNDNFIIASNDNYYTCTPDAYNAVAFRVGNRAYPFEQFDLRLNRPDIIMQRLGYASDSLIRVTNQAYQLRMKMMNVDTTKFRDDFVIPELELLSDIPFSTDNEDLKFKVFIKSKDDITPLNRLNVIVNNVPAYGMAGKQLKSNIFKDTIEIELKLSSGENNIKVSVFDDDYNESLRETFAITCNKQSKKPNLHLITVGVNDYTNFDGAKNLDYTIKDCETINNTFKQFGSNKFNVIQYNFTDSNAAKEKISKVKNELLKSDVEDIVVVFLSGHGVVYNNDFRYLTYNTSKETINENSLSFQEIVKIVDSIPARKKIIMIDACQSGEVYDCHFLADLQNDLSEEERECLRKKCGNIDLAKSNSDASKGIFYRSHSEVQPKFTHLCDKVFKNRNVFSVIDRYEELFVDLNSASGAIVLTASRGNEFAVEDKKLGNGAFTFFFNKAIETYMADNSKQGISALDIFSYIKENINKSADYSQTPTLKRGRKELDFILFQK